MEDYRTLLHITICHEYFQGKTNGMMDLRIMPESLRLLRSRGLIFKPGIRDEWELIGNVEGAGVNEEGDEIRFEFRLNDSAFGYYTEWKGYDSTAGYELDLSGCEGEIKVTRELQTIMKKTVGVFFSGKLSLSPLMFERAREGNSRSVSLNFTAKEMFWEYWLVPRKVKEQDYKLVLEEQVGGLLFSEPKPLYVDFMDRTVYRCVSQTVVKMREYYDFRMDLSEIISEIPLLKRKVLRHIECPVPGQFHDLKGNYLRKIVYF